MSTSSKSPRMVTLVALRAAKESLPEYAHRNSPKTYTQHQLFASLVLKRFFKTDYRGIAAILQDCPDIRGWLGLKKVPHWTTFQKASWRLLAAEPARDVLEKTVEYGLGRRQSVPWASGDSTGFRSDRESRHYTRRRAGTAAKAASRRTRRYPKANILVDNATHLVLAMLLSRGPRPDVDELRDLLAELPECVRLRHLLLDAGFDSEANHRLAREEHGILTTIPPTIGRPTSRPPTGHYRRLMAQTIHTREHYGQRWQVETVNSMIKRHQGDVVLGHTAWSRGARDAPGDAHPQPRHRADWVGFLRSNLRLFRKGGAACSPIPQFRHGRSGEGADRGVRLHVLVGLGLWCRKYRDPGLWCTNKRKRELSTFAISA